MKDDLFPEHELRAFLKSAPALPPDAAFEAAVLHRIQRRERRAVLLPALVAAIAIAVVLIAALPVLLENAALWASLSVRIGPWLNALRPIGDTLSTLAACAPSFQTVAWLLLGPLIVGLAAIMLLAFIIRRLSFRPIRCLI